VAYWTASRTTCYSACYSANQLADLWPSPPPMVPTPAPTSSNCTPTSFQTGQPHCVKVKGLTEPGDNCMYVRCVSPHTNATHHALSYAAHQPIHRAASQLHAPQVYYESQFEAADDIAAALMRTHCLSAAVAAAAHATPRLHFHSRTALTQSSDTATSSLVNSSSEAMAPAVASG
jgi:hypothetical protein